MKSRDASRALELYGEGKSISEVARILGISPYKAKKLQPQLAPKEPATQEEEDDDLWDCAIKVPLAQAEEIFKRATDNEKLAAFRQLADQDKMDCVLTILQMRMNELLLVPSVPACVDSRDFPPLFGVALDSELAAAEEKDVGQ